MVPQSQANLLACFISLLYGVVGGDCVAGSSVDMRKQVSCICLIMECKRELCNRFIGFPPPMRGMLNLKKRFPADCACYLGIIRPLSRRINLLFHRQTSRYVSGSRVAGGSKHVNNYPDLVHSYKTDKTNGQGRKTCRGDGHS